VAAIPGLNLPGAPRGHQQFGEMMALLSEQQIPAFVVGYDESIHPLTDLAGLYSDEHSIALTRVLPLLSAAVVRENEIRRDQQAPPLKEFILVAYSQGSVLAMDIFRYVFGYRLEWNKFLKIVGKEWDALKTDPHFILFKERADTFLVFKNILIQKESEPFQNYILDRFSQKLSRELADSFKQLQTYLITPEKVYPEEKLVNGRQRGYPRRYPKIKQWYEANYVVGIHPAKSGSINFWMQYVEFEKFLPLDFRLFSMAGSFFGSPMANKAYPLLEALPPGLQIALTGPIKKQIKDTKLGNRHHVNVLKAILKYRAEAKPGPTQTLKNVYFIVGAHGEKGDGIVDQSSAHLSSHLLSELSLSQLFGPTSSEPIRAEFKRLPPYPLTGLKVHHLPKKRLFFPDDVGVAYMDEKSIVFPFLIAFINKDYDSLEKLHLSENEPLRQFMVTVDLPLSRELDQNRFLLKPITDDIKLTGRYYNKSSHAIVWTGVFKHDIPYLEGWFSDLEESGKLVLHIEGKGKKAQVELNINPGINHFLEITSPNEEKQEPFLLGFPRVFKWSSKEVSVQQPK